jgi:hypothetical protein
VRSFSGFVIQEERRRRRRRRRTVWKGKACCIDEGSAFLQDMGNYLSSSIASTGNLNLQQHFCDTEISVITFGEHGAVAQRNNLIMCVVKGVFVWNLRSFPQVIIRMEVISCSES